MESGGSDLAFLPHMEGVQSKLGIETALRAQQPCHLLSAQPRSWALGAGMQRGQSLSDGTPVLALLADEAAVMG